MNIFFLTKDVHFKSVQKFAIYRFPSSEKYSYMNFRRIIFNRPLMAFIVIRNGTLTVYRVIAISIQLNGLPRLENMSITVFVNQ